MEFGHLPPVLFWKKGALVIYHLAEGVEESLVLVASKSRTGIFADVRWANVPGPNLSLRSPMLVVNIISEVYQTKPCGLQHVNSLRHYCR